MPDALVAVVAGAAAVGAFSQRVSGLGFSLIVAPSLALAVGPRDGIALTNVLSVVVSLSILATSIRHLDRARCAILLPAGLMGVIPGAIVFRLLPTGPLQVTVGVVTGLGLAAVAATRRLRVASGRGVTAAAGLASGFTTTVAGAGGPALAVYAVATDWPQRQFAATAQVNFAVQAIAALGIRGIPRLPLPWLGAAIAAAIGGLVVGHFLAHRIKSAHARRAAITLAALATAVTIVRGL